MNSSVSQTKPENANDNFEISNESDNQNLPLIASVNEGEICVQLEGSHTTATETETAIKDPKLAKNLQFQDELIEVYVVKAQTESSSENQTEEVTNDFPNVNNLSEEIPKSIENKDLEKIQPKFIQQENLEDQQKSPQKELQQIERENVDIADRFKEIMEMFDTFTKNLETLDLTPTPSASQGNILARFAEPKSKSEILIQPKQHRSRYGDYYNQQEKEIPVIAPQITTDSKASQVYIDKCSISTEMVIEEILTSVKPTQTLACQTFLHERTSYNDLSSNGPSTYCGETRSNFQNSLNNYAEADNVCPSPSTEKESCKNKSHEKLSKAVTETASAIELTSLLPEASVRNPIHTINIDATSSPSPSYLRRPPFCQRLWIVISDFLAATLLCLQVNRDCIFCLGFFIAFVVSASFLTAFFYHTLSMSPSLWASTSSAQYLARGENEIIGRYKIADLKRL